MQQANCQDIYDFEQPWPSPVVQISERLWAKLEFENPSASMKYRAIPFHLNQVLRDGELHRSQEVVIHSAGSAARTLAFACRRLGLSSRALVSPSSSESLRSYLTQWGMEVELCSSKEAPERMRSLKASGAYLLDQFGDPRLADFYQAIIEELISQREQVVALFAGIGSGQSITGMVRARNRSAWKQLRIFGVEPACAALSQGKKWKPHPFSGLAPPVERPLFQPQCVDELVTVGSEEGLAYVDVAKKYGLKLVNAAAAVLCAAKAYSQHHPREEVVAVLGA